MPTGMSRLSAMTALRVGQRGVHRFLTWMAIVSMPLLWCLWLIKSVPLVSPEWVSRTLRRGMTQQEVRLALPANTNIEKFEGPQPYWVITRSDPLSVVSPHYALVLEFDSGRLIHARTETGIDEVVKPIPLRRGSL